MGGNSVWMRSRGWGPRDGISALIKRDTRELTFLFWLPCDSKNTAVCKPEREPRWNLTMLVLDFQPSKLQENKLLLLKPPSGWCFVIIAQVEADLLIKY